MDQRTSTSVGDPDFVIARGQRVAFVEIKTQHGKLSKEQLRRHEELAQAGCIVKVARSLEDAIQWVDHEMNGVKAEPAPQPSQKPVFWIRLGQGRQGCGRCQGSHGRAGLIRIASELDKERFPRLTSWSPK